MERTKSYRILKMIDETGGMRYTEIQRALWEMSHPGRPMKCRGYWCTNLGWLLDKFCAKSGDGAYTLKRPIESPMYGCYVKSDGSVRHRLHWRALHACTHDSHITGR